MTRTEFYFKAIFLCVICAIGVYVSDTKEEMIMQVRICMIMIGSYLCWREFQLIPQSWMLWKKDHA
jgi:hypothetical protein